MNANVDARKLEQSGQSLEQACNQLRRTAPQLADVAGGLRFQASFRRHSDHIDWIAGSLGRDAEDLRRMQATLSNIIRLYENCELGIQDQMDAAMPPFQPSQTEIIQPQDLMDELDDSKTSEENWLDWLLPGIEIGKPNLIPILIGRIDPRLGLLAAVSGIGMGKLPEFGGPGPVSGTSESSWWGGKVNGYGDHDGKLSAAGWLYHNGGSTGGELWKADGSVTVGKVEASSALKAGLAANYFKKKDNWDDTTWKESTSNSVLEASAGIEAHGLDSSGGFLFGNDMLGIELTGDLSVGNAEGSLKGSLGINDDGLNAVVKGKLMASILEGKVGVNLHLAGVEVGGNLGGYAGGVGYKVNAGIEDSKLKLEMGAAEGLGLQAGVSIGLNDTGRQNFIEYTQAMQDMLCFWD